MSNLYSSILAVRDLKMYFPVRRGVMSRTVGYVYAVDGVTFSMDKKEILGLVGESGCSKTTLARTILMLEKPVSGQVLFDGKDLFKLRRRELAGLRKRLQIIFQDPTASLNPRMNILDILTEGLLQYGMVEGDRETHARKLLAEVGLDGDVIYRYPHEFSGGQRQRISIARAISLRPDFIVCDEPVSALDVSVQAQIINLLLDLRERYDLSYLFISHDLSVVGYIADRIAVMYLGRMVEVGPAGDVVEDPLHPYSQALLSAATAPGVYRKKRIILSGETPSPVAPPPGCVFHPRCPKSMPVCRKEVPRETVSGKRRVWCHLC
ncbi:MAG: peptide ABC transporter substrate-binding protein [Desulfobacterales bacterium CG23_combo_of_CG06-09_8_20_14_all_52_9]|nr:MAG: peptide ABC transporter substrate-binding protein [Desulfobacterales bacterium CG23_combo_of_CG06-09_8_20_14_all_52_9]